PRSYDPSSWIHAFTRFSDSNMLARSTMRSRTTGNFVIGSSTMGSPWGDTRSTSVLHAWRTWPLTSLVQAPPTSSRQFESHTTGAVFFPCTVWGRRWIAMSAAITFILGSRSTSNSSQRGAACALSWRLTLMRTALMLASLARSGSGLRLARLRLARSRLVLASARSLGVPRRPFLRVVLPLARRDQRRVHRLVVDLGLGGRRVVARARRLEEILVVAPGEIRLEVRPPRLVAQQRAAHDDARQHEHVPALAEEHQRAVRGAAVVEDARVLPPIHQLHDLLLRLAELVVPADDRAVARHPVAELVRDLVRVLRPVHLGQLAKVELLGLLLRGVDHGRRRIVGVGVAPAHRGRAGHESAEDARHERVGAQAVGAVVLVTHLAGGDQARDVRHVVVVDPQPAHRIVHSREHAHRHLGRVVADELLVDLDDALELLLQRGAPQVGEVEIDLILAVD